MNLPAPNADKLSLILQQNLVVRAWALKMQAQLKQSAATLTKGKARPRTRPATGGPLLRKFPNMKQYRESKLKSAVTQRVREHHGMADEIGFGIQRHGVFAEKGVGRGYQMRNGMVVRVDAKGVGRKKLDRAPSNKPFNRSPSVWFNSIIDRNTDVLADDLAKINEDVVVNALRFRIN